MEFQFLAPHVGDTTRMTLGSAGYDDHASKSSDDRMRTIKLASIVRTVQKFSLDDFGQRIGELCRRKFCEPIKGEVPLPGSVDGVKRSCGMISFAENLGMGPDSRFASGVTMHAQSIEDPEAREAFVAHVNSFRVKNCVGHGSVNAGLNRMLAGSELPYGKVTEQRLNEFERDVREAYVLRPTARFQQLWTLLHPFFTSSEKRVQSEGFLEWMNVHTKFTTDSNLGNPFNCKRSKLPRHDGMTELSEALVELFVQATQNGIMHRKHTTGFKSRLHAGRDGLLRPCDLVATTALKTDVYPWEKVRDKTRVYWVFPAKLATAWIMIFQLVGRAEINAFNSTESRNVLGFVGQHGGGERLFELLSSPLQGYTYRGRPVHWKFYCAGDDQVWVLRIKRPDGSFDAVIHCADMSNCDISEDQRYLARVTQGMLANIRELFSGVATACPPFIDAMLQMWATMESQVLATFHLSKVYRLLQGGRSGCPHQTEVNCGYVVGVLSHLLQNWGSGRWEAMTYDLALEFIPWVEEQAAILFHVSYKKVEDATDTISEMVDRKQSKCVILQGCKLLHHEGEWIVSADIDRMWTMAVYNKSSQVLREVGSQNPMLAHVFSMCRSVGQALAGGWCDDNLYKSLRAAHFAAYRGYCSCEESNKAEPQWPEGFSPDPMFPTLTSSPAQFPTMEEIFVLLHQEGWVSGVNATTVNWAAPADSEQVAGQAQEDLAEGELDDRQMYSAFVDNARQIFGTPEVQACLKSLKDMWEMYFSDTDKQGRLETAVYFDDSLSGLKEFKMKESDVCSVFESLKVIVPIEVLRSLWGEGLWPWGLSGESYRYQVFYELVAENPEVFVVNKQGERMETHLTSRLVFETYLKLTTILMYQALEVNLSA